jgi:NitT/TauT family transport system ATP-binding protein
VRIEVQNVSKQYLSNQGEVRALENIDLVIGTGQFVCLLGPSGCGKSTLLNLLAGFDSPSQGQVRIDGKVVEKPSPKFVTVFQQPSLLPWRNVQRNIELGLEAQRVKKTLRRETSGRLMEWVGLGPFKKHHPHQLSGGMQQRVAIARALAVNPPILFMDEPFGALDAGTRMNMQEELLNLWQRKKMTIIFVTHDIEEAVYLADRIIVLTPFPGKVKCALDIPLPRNRDRTAPEFLSLRSRIFSEFQIEQQMIEYYL